MERPSSKALILLLTDVFEGSELLVVAELVVGGSLVLVLAVEGSLVVVLIVKGLLGTEMLAWVLMD